MLLLLILTPLLFSVSSWALSPLGCLKRLEAMEYRSAIVYGDRLIQSGNRNYTTYLCVGRAHLELRNYALAIDYLERANNRARDEVERVLSAFYLGSAYEGIGNYTRAINLYRNVLQNAERISQSIYISLVFRLAEAYEKVNNLEDALKTYMSIENRSLSDKDKLIVLEKIGDIMLKKRDYTMAMKAYDGALLVASSLNDIFSLGRINAKMGDISMELKSYDKALEQYEQAISYARSAGTRKVEASLYERIAVAYTMKNDFAEALNSYQRAVELYRLIGDRSNQLRVQERLEVIRRLFEVRRDI
ncbi:tetratricopeptide repeat protein [Hydrogenobacter sp. T-2]|uniref:tetratricopeptide repeat protein n=1 Tax=Pampinifervens diazotrophicum TaxID=1632018 RepID=UPI002B263344|nr:tetratricopeptide repeat protein [Hydrogenobacter sp. T-2]WPM32962.1 tetratricopeptide repeat protein [Hydrogenobacter sp. T-2]